MHPPPPPLDIINHEKPNILTWLLVYSFSLSFQQDVWSQYVKKGKNRLNVTCDQLLVKVTSKNTQSYTSGEADIEITVQQCITRISYGPPSYWKCKPCCKTTDIKQWLIWPSFVTVGCHINIQYRIPNWNQQKEEECSNHITIPSFYPYRDLWNELKKCILAGVHRILSALKAN